MTALKRPALIALGIGLLLSIALACFAVTPVVAHSWYPYNCCHDMDCAPVGDNVLKELPDGRGYLVVPTGEVISYNDNRVKGFSPDGDSHRCAMGGASSNTRTICIWPKGSGF